VKYVSLFNNLLRGNCAEDIFKYIRKVEYQDEAARDWRRRIAPVPAQPVRYPEGEEKPPKKIKPENIF
jgi:hypothetical protein